MGTCTVRGATPAVPPGERARTRVLRTLEEHRDELARLWCGRVPDVEARGPELESYLRALISGLAEVVRSGDWRSAQSLIDEIAQRRMSTGEGLDRLVQHALLSGRVAVRSLLGRDENGRCEDLFLEISHECVLRFAESYQGLRLVSESERMHTRIIKSLVMSLEARDTYTKGHSLSVAILAQRIAQALIGADPAHAYLAGLLHDVGKIGIPDAILLKPGPLSGSKWGVMKTHCAIGERILKPINLYADVTAAVATHHENHDGSGYPYGLEGDDIPPIARILRVADSFDAMTTTRIYRSSRSSDEAISEIERCSGTLYSPEVVNAFTRIIRQPGVSSDLSQASLQIDLEEFVV